jgi:hypothetical protein
MIVAPLLWRQHWVLGRSVSGSSLADRARLPGYLIG